LLEEVLVISDFVVFSRLYETENIKKFGINPKLVENFNEWKECSFELCMGETKIIDKLRESSKVEEKLRLTSGLREVFW
jgi:hypothetical protein